ncbi:MAG: SDR family NAD(P)-dependent oxidoreductase, partial [Gaiellaceae bacterium]
MDLGLRDRLCLVTGSTTGIGFETARLLAQEGAHVVITGRDPDRVEQARVATGAALGITADLSDPTAPERLLSGIGQVPDCLVNNVGEAYQA